MIRPLPNAALRPLVATCAALMFAASSGCDPQLARALETASSKADARVSNVRLDHDARVVGGELDYGVTVSCWITNVGERGPVRVTATLSSSEGEWSRVQTIDFAAGGSDGLSYFFAEPSINATNLQCVVRAVP